jgi:hypothetical protein
MSDPDMGVVYTLNDPRTDEPRYVGATKNPQFRYKRHVSDPHKEEIERWVSELDEQGMKPDMKVIDRVKVERLEKAERAAIRSYRSVPTHNLLNADSEQPYVTDRGSKDGLFEGDTTEEVTVTVQMDANGRLVVPKSARRALGVSGEAAVVRVDAEVIADASN